MSVRDVEHASRCGPQGIRMSPNPHTTYCTRTNTHTHACCELDSTTEASVEQAYYSSPEGVVSLLTGRHKYSSTSSPRVNGCPSASNETYWAWCRHTVCGYFHWNSKVTYGDGEKTGRTRSHMRQALTLNFSMFTQAKIHRFIQKISPTHLKSAYKFTFEYTHADLCGVWFGVFLCCTQLCSKQELFY